MVTPPPLPGESSHTLEAFIRSTSRPDEGRGVFERKTDKLLEVNLAGRVNTKMGSMVAYQGSIRFRTCIQKQVNLLEAIGRTAPGVTGTTLAAICN